MKNRLLIVFFAILFLITSCSKDSVLEQPAVKSDSNDLISFRLERSANPMLTEDCSSFISGSLVYVSVPKGVSLVGLKANIQVSPKATVVLNGTPHTNNLTEVNYVNTVTILITSESGKTKTYTALVQSGIATLDNVVYAFMKKYSIPGISYAISKNEQVVYSSGVGFAIKETNERVKPNNLFRLASISKQFTSLCILKLMEAGKLNLDQKVFGIGGILQNEFSNISANASLVTVRHLLHQVSGWVSNPDPMFTDSFNGQTLDQLINYVLQSPQSTPGTKYSYYNMGFGILGKIIEKVSAKSYETYLKEVLLEAGITDIHVGGDKSQRRSNEVVYYSQDGTNGYANEMNVIAAAGGIIASTQDMLKLLSKIDGYTSVPDIITGQTRAIMLTPSSVNNRYAHGWMVNHTYFPGCCYHTGNLAGTAVMWVMGNGLNAVVLCNSRSYISSFDDELYGLLRDIRTLASGMNW